MKKIRDLLEIYFVYLKCSYNKVEIGIRNGN